MSAVTLEQLAESGDLGGVIMALERAGMRYRMEAHWTQGEFHHDVVLRVDGGTLPGDVLVVSTNCNGAVKELLSLREIPDRGGLWHFRCPENPEFSGPAPSVAGAARTWQWKSPCDMLAKDDLTELRPECRARQAGGGYVMI